MIRPLCWTKCLSSIGAACALVLAVSCGSSATFCDDAGNLIPAAPSSASLAASYTNVTTTVGTPLAVAPQHSGAAITGAALSRGTLPPGMVLNPDGSISGTPTQGGVYPLAIGLSGQGQTVVCPEIITVNPATADPLDAQYTDATVMVGTPLSVPPAVIDGGPVTSAVVVAGPLPPGMTLASGATPAASARAGIRPQDGAASGAGVISGTPTTAGVYPLAMALGNASGAVAVVPVTITVNQVQATPLQATYTDASGAIGAALSVAPAIPSGGPVAAATLLSGLIPPGMVLDPDGSIAGTPTTSGTYRVQVELRNASGALAAQWVTITVSAAGTPALGASYANLSTTVGSTVDEVPVLQGGSPVAGATLINGSLPPGLTLNPGGSVTGVATTAGLYTLTVQLCDAAGACQAVTFKMTVDNDALGLGYATPKTFAAGTAIPVQLPNLTHGGSVSITYSVSSGSLPAGLTLNPDGSITGIPTAPGVAGFTVTASDGVRSASTALVYTVDPAAPSPVYPALTTTVATPLTVTPLNAGGPIASAALAGGSLPPGMTLNPATGIISGTPTAPGVFTAQVTTCNASAICTTVPVTLTVNPLATDPLTAAYVNAGGILGSPIAPVAPAVTDGGPVTSAILANGTLPAGLVLDAASGVITGTPTRAGAFPLLINLGNGSGGTLTVPLTLTVSATGATALAAGYPNADGMVGTPLQVAPTATAGGPVTGASLAGGCVPLGMALNPATGSIAGTPLAAGTYPASIALVNASGGQVTAPVTITVNTVAAPLVAAYSPATGRVGSTLATLTPALTSGGPISGATLASGSLPPGLSMDPVTGIISGTPTVSGTYQLQVQLQGAGGATTVVPLTITVTQALPAIVTPNLTVTVGTSGIEAPTDTGGTITSATLTAGGPLPVGLTLNSNGTLTENGTTPVGVYGPFTINYCNETGCVSSTVTVRIDDIPPVVAPFNITEPMGSTTTLTPASTGGAVTSATVTAGGPLATGLTLNANGTLSQSGATPPGTYVYTVQYGNSGGQVSSTLSITVSAPPLVAPFTVTEPVGTTTLLTPSNTGGAITGATITSGGPIAAGLTLNANGTLSQAGTTPAGTYVYTVQYTNAGGSASSSVTINVIAAPAVAPFTVTEAVGATALLTPSSTGGAVTGAAITAGGPIAAGLTLNANGTISQAGTTPAGTYAYTVQYTNAGGAASSSVTINVIAAPVVAPFTVTEAVGATTLLTPSSSGGAVTSTAITAGGPIAAGLTLNANGTISQAGTTPAGTYAYTVQYTNAGGSASSTVSISIIANPSVSAFAITETYGATTLLTPVNSGGAITSASIIAGGPIATGLTLNANGTLSQAGTTPAGTYTYTVTFNNAYGSSSTTVTITIVAVPTANLVSNPPTVPVNQASSLTILFTGSANGTAQLTGDGITGTLAVTSGTSISTGVVTVPLTTRNYTLTVTNAAGGSAVSTASVQWIQAPSDTWTVSIPSSGVGSPFTPGSGSLLNGLISITVPDQGQDTCDATAPVTLTVNREAILPGPAFPLASGAVAYSEAFNIASNVGYPFRVPISISLAYNNTLVGANDLPMPFFWDPSYQAWVAAGLQSINTTTHMVTFTTLLPGQYAVLGIPNLALATRTTGFASGTDDWLQNDPTNFDLPGGASLGMSSFASWFYSDRKATNAGIGLYGEWASASNVDALALISRLGNGTLDSWAAAWNQPSYGLTSEQTGLALVTGLMVTGQPQIFLMSDSPARSSAVATAIYGYNFTNGTFSVMDPNYPGDTLTISWNSATGAFSNYSRAQGYAPALAQYAFQGQTSIHRQADYDTLLSGAAANFAAPTYASISINSVSVSGYPTITNPDLASPVVVGSNANITVQGTVTNGDQAATSIFVSQNGGSPRTAVQLTPVNATTSTFSFTLTTLDNPYGTAVVLETTANPCDPTFSHTGYLQFSLQQSGLSPWFPNACFEQSGTTAGTYPTNPWVLQHGSNSGKYYPWQGTGSSNNNPPSGSTTVASAITNYSPTWTTPVDNDGAAAAAAKSVLSASPAAGTNISGTGTGPYSALVDSPSHVIDPNVPGTAPINTGDIASGTASTPGITMVLAGNDSFMVNDPVKGNHISRAIQTLTVPNTIANPRLTFYWAGATQSGGHTPDQSPFIDILVQDTTSTPYEVLYYVHHFAPSTVSGTTYTDGYPGWISSGIETGGSGSGYVWYGINWQKVSLNLGPSSSTRTIVLTVTAAGCEPSGHAGYAYIDSMTCE